MPIGSHQSAAAGTDVWPTPPEIVAALGGAESFGLDPCAPLDRPWDMARQHYTIADNGLARPWTIDEWFNQKRKVRLQMPLPCSRCGEIKPESEFQRRRDRRSRRGYASWCKGCARSHARGVMAKKRATDPEKIRETKKRHSQSERARASRRRRSFLDNHVRRQRRLALPFIWNEELWAACLKRFDFLCVYCDGAEALTQDHFIPLSSRFCPGTVPWNIVPACGRCNRSKWKRLPWTFVEDRERLRSIVSRLRVSRVQSGHTPS